MATKPLFLLAPGAGAPSTSEWMKGWAKRLSTLGEVVPMDYDYQLRGKKAPDRLPKLIEAHKARLAEARRGHRGPVVLIGKSMGGRVGCHLSLEDDVDVDAIVCLGFPLKAAGKSGAIRDQVLVDLRTPVLLVSGDRDPMGPLDLFAEVRGRMKAKNEMVVVAGGNHSLDVSAKQRKAAGITQADSDATVLEAIGAFLKKHLG